MNAEQIEQVRRFNRAVTQRIGALENSYLHHGRPLAEARLIFEIGEDGTDARSLRRRLRLDAGYFSRLLKSLENQGLVAVSEQEEDRRVRRVRLTEDGQAERETYDALSEELAGMILAPLEPAERDRLVAAMAEVERLIMAAAVDVKPELPGSPDAKWCLARYVEDLAERFETGFDPQRSNPAPLTDMRPPRGVLMIARLDGRPVGCGVLKRKDATTGEIKRMWTAPDARGRGVARRVLRALEAAAKDFGLTKLQLETNRTLHEAQALYRSEGYREVAPFNDEPYAHHWFEKTL
jgi:DNA-binding MarR family transcriptional regulator